MNSRTNSRRFSILFAASALCALAGAQTTIGSQTRVDNGRGTQPCNETTMSASKANPLEIVGGWNDYRNSPQINSGFCLSLDGGATWSDFIIRPPVAHQTTVEGDPMTAFDDRTGTIWAGAMSFGGNGGIYVARKDPGATSFNPSVMARISSGVDKGWLSAGVDPANANLTRLYCAYNEGIIRSTDMGATWTSPLNLGSGLGFLPRVGPSGEVYVVYWDTAFGVFLRRSFNGGVSFGPPITVATRMDTWGLDGSRFPGNYRVAALAGFAVDPHTGALYVVYPDTTSVASNGSNVDVYFTKSVDQGATWSVPKVINGDTNPPGDQFFPWIEVDASGRISMVTNDTRNTLQNDNAPQGLIDNYYTYSDDGGASWTEVRLTSAPWSTANDGFGGTFIGDYLGLGVGGHRTMPLYMSTQNGNADIFTHVIVDGPATTYCYGIGCPCANNDPTRGCANLGSDGATTTGALLSVGGTNVVANDDLTFAFSGLKPGAFSLLYTGQTRSNTPFGDGAKCIGGTVFRFAVKQANASGIASYAPGEIVGYATTHFGASGQIQPGATWHYQGWYRDTGGPCGSGVNFTNAASVTWQ